MTQFGLQHFLSAGAEFGGAARDTVAVALGGEDIGTATIVCGGAARSVADCSDRRVGEADGDENRTGVPARLV